MSNWSHLVDAPYAVAMSAALMAAVCTPRPADARPAPTQDDHFRCAAIISAADRLISSGKVKPVATIVQNGLLASMSHLNAWAIPKGLAERDAFDRVNAERERLLATLDANEIVKRATSCVEQIVRK